MIGAAAQTKTKLLGGGNYSMCPLDIDDLNQAILNCCNTDSTEAKIIRIGGTRTHQLSRPHSEDRGDDE